MAWDGLNRRQFVRVAYPCLVKIAAAPEDVEDFLAHTENIGVGGICVIFKKEIKMFTQVDIEIDMMDGIENIVTNGRAVWVVRRKATEDHKPSMYDVGLEFETLTPKNKGRIETAIQKLIEKGYKILKPVY